MAFGLGFEFAWAFVLALALASAAQSAFEGLHLFNLLARPSTTGKLQILSTALRLSR
jgi:hypothetical protein